MQVVFDTVVSTFELKFENLGYLQMVEAANKRKDDSMPIRASLFFDIFPFCILFNVSMTETLVGRY